MKKRNLRGIITSLVVIMTLGIIINLGAVFAESEFTLVESYPEDGSTNAALENLGAKINFSTAVDAQENRAVNDKCFKMTSEDANVELPIKVYYNPKDEKQVLVIYDVNEGGQISSKGSLTFKITISGDFTDNEGRTLGDDIELTFTTINQSRNNKIYLVLLLLMMALMSILTMRQQRKKMEEESSVAVVTKDEPFNPYKEAKRTGKSVEEVIVIHEKEVAKREAKAAKNAPKQYVFDDDEDYDTGTYKVKGPRPASAAGSKFVADRKEKAGKN